MFTYISLQPASLADVKTICQLLKYINNSQFIFNPFLKCKLYQPFKVSNFGVCVGGLQQCCKGGCICDVAPQLHVKYDWTNNGIHSSYSH